MRTALISLALAVVTAGAVPASGIAGLPKPLETLIEVPESIGDVALKQRLQRADGAWGETGDCDYQSDLQSCAYQSSDPRKGRASVEAGTDGRVTGFAIEAGTSEGDFVFEGRLLGFETAEGIGLGDKRKRVPKAYPNAIKTANRTGYFIEGKGRSLMAFQTLDGTHITAITVVDGRDQD